MSQDGFEIRDSRSTHIAIHGSIRSNQLSNLDSRIHLQGSLVEPINLYELADQVDTRESFLDFVHALMLDCEEKSKLPGPWESDWENGTIAGFLDACLRWAEASSALSGEDMVGPSPTWRTFAQILHAGKFYE